MRPLHDFLLVKEKKEETTESGLIIPESAKMESLVEAEVVDVGPDVEDLKAGDLVYFKSAGNEIKLDKHIYFIRYERLVAAEPK